MKRTLPDRGLLVLGLALTAIGLGLFIVRARFVERSELVDGVVVYTTRYTLGVQPNGEATTVSVRRPSFHLYRTGQAVRIRLDRRAALPGQIGVAGRADSFFGLWLLPTLVTWTGLLFTLGAAATARSLRLRFELGVSDDRP